MSNPTDIQPNQSILAVIPYGVDKAKPLSYLKTYQELAERYSCKLVLFSAIYDRAAEIDTWVSGTYLENFRKPLVKHHQQWLERQADQLRSDTVSVDVVVEWEKHPIEAIQAYLSDHSVSLIVGLASHHHVISRALHQPLEWQLIRLPNIPVLLLQTPTTLIGGKVALSMDVAQSGNTQDDANDYLIQATKAWCDRMESSLNLVNAYPSAADFLAYAPAEWQMPELQGDLAKQHKSRLDAYLAKTGLSGETYVGEGQPGEVVDQLTEEIGAQLVVIGSECRKGVSGLLIGNAAESLLEHSERNILVFKP